MDQNLLSALTTLLAPLLVYISHALVSFLKAKTKHGNLQLLLTWAHQAVAMMENKSLPGPSKKARAIELVTGRLKANKLLGKFSDDQIAAVIEQAVLRLNTLEVKEKN